MFCSDTNRHTIFAPDAARTMNMSRLLSDDYSKSLYDNLLYDSPSDDVTDDAEGHHVTDDVTTRARRRRRRSAVGGKMAPGGEAQDLRLRVNGRERQRMHDLNAALDGLREVNATHAH